MSKKQYIRALNKEIGKLNEIIDRKIVSDHNYRSEARRHKKLLAEIRRQEVQNSAKGLFRSLVFRG